MNVNSALRSEAALAAARAKAAGLTQSDIASALGASQSQVSRVLAGTARRRSKLFDRVCKYVFSRGMPGTGSPAESPELMAALAEVWNGSDEHAEALALVIRSLGALSGKR